MKNLGIVQGRLIKSPPGKLQWFPQEDWEKEFYIASAIGIENIELIAERVHNEKNPIWTDSGIDELLKISKKTNVNIHTLCNDHVVDFSLVNNPKVLDQNLNLIKRGAKLNCNKYVLPLFEMSELNMNNYSDFISPIKTIANACKKFGMVLCLETILNGKDLKFVLNKLKNKNIKVVFDTGNRIAFGHDLYNDIVLLGNNIEHVHIKDKDKKNKNVLLSTGLVDFNLVFKALKKINYQKSYTFETYRGKNPIRTAKFNMELVKFFCSENFNLI